jgi:hypothetical protein
MNPIAQNFPGNRAARLKPLLEKLEKVPGVRLVGPDDWDSVGINVVFQALGSQYKLTQPLQATKARIAKVCNEAGVVFSFTDWPKKTRRYNGKLPGGKTLYFDEGYDTHRIIIGVAV